MISNTITGNDLAYAGLPLPVRCDDVLAAELGHVHSRACILWRYYGITLRTGHIVNFSMTCGQAEALHRWFLTELEKRGRKLWREGPEAGFVGVFSLTDEELDTVKIGRALIEPYAYKALRLALESRVGANRDWLEQHYDTSELRRAESEREFESDLATLCDLLYDDAVQSAPVVALVKVAA